MSSYGLNSETKKSVKSTVLALRNLLEGEFDPDTGDPIPPGGDVVRQIARYGILVNKPESLKSENAPEYLTDEEKKKRERISAAIKREVAIFGKLSNNAALRRGMRAYIRQTSYTWINRLLGLRCMEARGLLKDDRGELDFVVTPSDDYGGLPRRAWRIKGKNPARWQTAKLYDLQCEAIADSCRQLTQEIKVLFDPEHDYGLIWPSATALNTLLQKIQELDKVATPSPFASPDFLGWVYQYFQTIEKDLVFQAASKKKKKIEKDDVIPATQIYTEHYMVEYLVQNSLGRLWMEMHPDSKLSANWAYYVKPPEENPPVERELKKAIEIKLMDPAVGSGHFHLVAFDLLLDMYEEEIENVGQPGWLNTPSVEYKKDIPAAILEHNLFGIDIDARSIQLASLVLVMKARETGYEGPINHLNLVVANNAPFESEAWYQFIRNLEKEGKHSVARVLAALGLQLKNLDEFGSLLRIEDDMQKIIQEEKKQWIAQAKMGPEQDYLFPEMAKPRQEKLPFETAITDETFFDRLGSVIHKELDTFYLKARQDGLAEEAIMAADAERGFDFARLSMQRYDVVYTNPPYMGSKNMGDRLKKFVASAYPQGKRDLYAAFILRCREMTESNGYVGMVTQQSWMFLRSFVELRALPGEKLSKSKAGFKGLLREATMETLAHLGAGAFSEIGGEVVNTVLFILRNAPPQKEHQMAALRVTGVTDSVKKAMALRESLEKTCSSFVIEPLIFIDIPSAPIIYWIRPYFSKLLKEWPKLSSKVTIRDGISSGGTDRALRFHWECAPNERWRKHEKGGGYCKWLGLRHYLIDWIGEGEVVKQQKGGFIRNPSFFGKPGLVYSRMAQGSLGARVLKSWSFDTATRAIFALDEKVDLYDILAILNTRTTSYFLRLLVQGFDFSGGYTEQIPIPQTQSSLSRILTSICLELKNAILWADCTDPEFRDVASAWQSSISAYDRSIEVHLLVCEGTIEQQVFDDYLISGKDRDAILSETGTPASWYPLIIGYDALPSLPAGLPEIPKQVLEFLDKHERLNLNHRGLAILKKRLRSLYEAGPGAKQQIDVEQKISVDDEKEVALDAGAYIPIPAESFTEELSQKLEIHPISVYWLLEEMKEKEGLVCPSEMKRHLEDYLSVMIIRMLGYQWPKQAEAGEALPGWADNDGIIPLTDGFGEPTLLDRIRNRFGADFGEEKEASIESEFANIVGKPLERWLEEEFFARHAKQFKNRPIAWHIVSDPSVVNHEAGQSGQGKKKGAKKKQKPAFSVMVHYHRFMKGDKGYGKLLLLKNKYLAKLMTQTRAELESLRGEGDDFFDRIAELDRKLVELEDLRDRLERIQEGKDPESSIYVRWKSAEEQPQGWRPDINDGVKINIAPWERLGMFPVKKIVGNVEMAPK